MQELPCVARPFVQFKIVWEQFLAKWDEKWQLKEKKNFQDLTQIVKHQKGKQYHTHISLGSTHQSSSLLLLFISVVGPSITGKFDFFVIFLARSQVCICEMYCIKELKWSTEIYLSIVNGTSATNLPRFIQKLKESTKFNPLILDKIFS